MGNTDAGLRQVNLPAYLVVVKSTMYYQGGEYTAYPDSQAGLSLTASSDDLLVQVLQMMGRAGRPQFGENEATAVIMTHAALKARFALPVSTRGNTLTALQPKYDMLVEGSEQIESNLHLNFVEHLNAEIRLGTIADGMPHQKQPESQNATVNGALNWLRATFLFVRIQKNPTRYGIASAATPSALEHHLQGLNGGKLAALANFHAELCMRELKRLADASLVVMDGDTNLSCTPNGISMAKYSIAFDSMVHLTSCPMGRSMPDLVCATV